MLRLALTRLTGHFLEEITMKRFVVGLVAALMLMLAFLAGVFVAHRSDASQAEVTVQNPLLMKASAEHVDLEILQAKYNGRIRYGTAQELIEAGLAQRMLVCAQAEDSQISAYLKGKFGTVPITYQITDCDFWVTQAVDPSGAVYTFGVIESPNVNPFQHDTCPREKKSYRIVEGERFADGPVLTEAQKEVILHMVKRD
jgi:hypothetical protein